MARSAKEKKTQTDESLGKKVCLVELNEKCPLGLCVESLNRCFGLEEGKSIESKYRMLEAD